MPFVIFLLLLVAALSGVTLEGPNLDQQQQFENEAGVIAQQMAWYHNEAVKLCSAPATCPAGAITVPLADLPPGATASYASNFKSVTNGSEVITVLLPTSHIWTFNGLQGLVNAAVTSQSSNSPYAGPWNSATQTVNGTTGTTQDALTYTGFISVPQGIGGLTLVTGEPVMVTPL